MFSQLIAECRDLVTSDLFEDDDSPPKFKSQLRDKFMPNRHKKRLKAHYAAVQKHRDDAEQAKSTAFIGKLRGDREKERKAQHASDYHPNAVHRRRQAGEQARMDRESERRAKANKDQNDRAEIAGRNRDPNPHKSWH